VAGRETGSVRALAPLLIVSAVVVLLSFGFAKGLWLPNLHNGLLAAAFTFVGAYVLFQRPGHLEGRLFLATGTVEAVVFFGRQHGHFTTSPGSHWWGWLGVWPTVVALALTTFSVLCFPDGRLPSPQWRWVAAVIVLVTAACATMSAIWPVEYSSAGVITRHPLNAQAPGVAKDVWSALAHPAYAVFQILWVVAVVVRWRASTPPIRRQLSWLVSAAALSVVALGIGLIASGSPRAGVLTAALVPVAAGWAIVHGQHVAAYSALSWLSRTAAGPADLPTDLARAVAEALTAPRATLWIGDVELHALGVWPETDGDIASITLDELSGSEVHHMRVISRRGEIVGALSVDRPAIDQLSRSERRLFDDLASQASFVIDHIGLAELIERESKAGHLDGLSLREREVLELMARGRSNAAICEELHLSIKTVEPIVSSIFAKLGLYADAASNRRVLAVLAYLQT
jgi:DNA-binding CsgD family transcriptional regulator